MNDQQPDFESERLKQLEEKKQAILDQIAREKNRLKEQTRKRNTRRKILAGAIALSTCEKDPEFKKQFFDLLSRFIEKPQDRELLDLPTLQQKDDMTDFDKASQKK